MPRLTLEQRQVVKNMVAEGKTDEEIHAAIGGACSIDNIYQWRQRLKGKNGQSHGSPRNGRAKKPVEKMITAGPIQVALDALAEELNLLRSRAARIESMIAELDRLDDRPLPRGLG